MKKKFCCLGLLCTLVIGCATSDVAPMGGNAYMITRHVWGFTGTAPIKAELLKDADDYCRSQGKVLLVTKIIETGLKFGGEPTAEVYFRALDPNDPELKNPPVIEEIQR
jgi:hypothetical protein